MNPRKTDERLLAELEAVAGRQRELADELATVHRRRDLLIWALYRRGCSLRKIAGAAGIHWTRVRQITADADGVAAEASLKPRRGRPKKGRKP